MSSETLLRYRLGFPRYCCGFNMISWSEEVTSPWCRSSGPPPPPGSGLAGRRLLLQLEARGGARRLDGGPRLPPPHQGSVRLPLPAGRTALQPATGRPLGHVASGPSTSTPRLYTFLYNIWWDAKLSSQLPQLLDITDDEDWKLCAEEVLHPNGEFGKVTHGYIIRNK